jgi:hypothetical protein
MKQRVERIVRDDPYIASASAISSGWTTARNEFLSAKCRYTVASFATLYSNLRAINKHLNRKRRPALSL